MDDSTLWSFTTGASFATDFRKFGLNALKLTTSGTVVADLSINLDLTSGYLGCWIKTDEPNNITNFNVWAQVGGNWGSFFMFSGVIEFSVNLFKSYDMDSWKHVTLPKSSFALISGVLATDWSRITALRFSLQASGNLTANVWVDRVEQFQYASPCTTGGFFTVIIDDDGAPTTYSAKKGIAASYNFWPTWAFNPVGGTANFPNLLAWLASGSDACHHGPTSTDYLTRSDEPENREPRIEWNLLYGRLPLAAWSVGKYMKYGAWGGGGYCPRALTIAAKNFVLYRSTGGGYESWPPGDRMRLRAHYIQALALSTAGSMVSTAVANREWLICYTHTWDANTDNLASWAYGQGYSHFGIHQAWSYLKKLIPPEELPADGKATQAGAQDIWAYPPSAASNTIVPSYNGPAMVNVNYAYQDDGGVFTDYTAEAASDAANDIAFYPATPATNDAFYFGFSGITPVADSAYWMLVNIGTAASGTHSIKWEYYNGTAWVQFTTIGYDLSDKTSGFKSPAGWRSVRWTFITAVLPMNWSQVSVNSAYAYWLRARFSGGAFTTVPSGTRLGFANPAAMTAVTGFSQPVPPRNLTLSYSSVSMGPKDTIGYVYIWGMNALGESTYAAISPGFSGLLATQQYTFAWIQAISCYGIASFDNYAVGWGENLGLSKRLIDGRDGFSLGIRAASIFSPGWVVWKRHDGGLHAYNNHITLTSLASSEIIVVNYITRDIAKDIQLDDNGQ
jgi:hypothetical protein